MNNEIKQGDKVRVSRDIPQFYLEYNSYRMFEIEHRVVDVNMVDGFALLDSIPPKFTTILPTKYLVKVDTEAKEAKFKKGDKVRYIGNIQEHKGEMFVIDGDIFFNDYYKQWQASSLKTIPTGRWSICNVPLSDLEPDTKPTEQTEAEKPNHTIKIPVEVDLTDGYWDAYAAYLAKEIVLKTVNSASDRRPMAIAEYATDIAKAVVEGLKRK